MIWRIRGNKKLVIAVSLIAFLAVTAVYGFSIFLTGGSLLFGERPDGNTQMMVPEAVPTNLAQSGIVIKGVDAVLEAQLKRPDFLLQSDGIASEEFVLIVEDWGRLIRPPQKTEGWFLAPLHYFDEMIEGPGGSFVPSDIILEGKWISYRILVGLKAPPGVAVDWTIQVPFAEEVQIPLEEGVTQVILVQ